MPKQNSEICDIEVFLHHETPAAILVSPNNERGSPKNQWLAKSLVEYRIKKGNLVIVTLPAWLAVDKHLDSCIV